MWVRVFLTAAGEVLRNTCTQGGNPVAFETPAAEHERQIAAGYGAPVTAREWWLSDADAQALLDDLKDATAVLPTETPPRNVVAMTEPRPDVVPTPADVVRARLRDDVTLRAFVRTRARETNRTPQQVINEWAGDAT